jgi:large subunit ribosomal protein L22
MATTVTDQLNKARASQKYIRISPYKLRRVANVIRGKQVNIAESILKNIPQKGAKIIQKVLLSAKANAVNNAKMNAGDLYISEILVNEGPQMKRFQPRARGRIYKIIKRSSHISLALGLFSSKKGAN